MNAAGAYLDEAGVVTDPLRAIITAAHEVGCLAAKPTGAGGGGCILALLSAAHGDAQIVALNERLGGTRVCAVELI
jgi:mevalonate kinase